MWPNPQKTADLVKLLKKSLMESLIFLCSELFLVCSIWSRLIWVSVKILTPLFWFLQRFSTWKIQRWNPQKRYLTKMAPLAKKCPKVTLFAKDSAEWLIFERKFLNFLFHSRMLFLVHSPVSNGWGRFY